MKRQCLKTVACVAVMFCSFGIFADAVFTNRGIINGLASFSVSGLESGQVPEVEYLNPVTGEYVAQSIYQHGPSGYYNFGTSASVSSLHFGNVTCRVRVQNSGSEWTPLTYFTGDTLPGTLIWGDSKFPSSCPPAKIVDGIPDTQCEPTWTGKEWVGMDFGEPRVVTGCKVMPRGGWLGRLSGRVIEVSDTADFATSTVVCTIPEINDLRIYELTFDQPVRTRYIRLAPGSQSQIWNIAELSFQGTERVTMLELSTNFSDLGNGDLRMKLSWNSAKAYYLTNRIYSATAVGGPWALRTNINAMVENSWVDDSVREVGEKTFYCIADVDNAGVESSKGAPVAFVRSTRLDVRTAQGGLADGLTAFGMKIGRWAMPLSNTFDDNLSNYTEGLTPSSTGDIALGLDMGTDRIVTAVRNYPRGGWAKRVNGAAVYGTPVGQDSNLASSKICGETVVSTVSGWNSNVKSFAELPVGRVYLYKDLVGMDAFYGNLTELQFYGYPASVLATRLTTPEYPTVLQRENGLLVTWEPCVSATSYELERRVPGGEWANVYTGTAASYLDTGVTANTVYQYRTKTVKGAASGYSRAIEVKFTGSVTPISSTWEEAYGLGSGVSGSASDSDGTVTISGRGGDLDRYGEKGFWLKRGVSGDIETSCTAAIDPSTAVNGQTLSLTVRAGEGEGEPFASVGFKLMKSFDGVISGAFGVRSRTTVNGAVTESDPSWTVSVTNLVSAQLRLQKKSAKVTCWARPDSSAEWSEIAEVSFADNTFGAKVRTGLLASAPADAQNAAGSAWTVSDYTCSSVKSRGLAIFVR